MIVQRRQILRKGHRPGSGGLMLRLRRPIVPASTLAAPAARQTLPKAVSEPFWLMESDMSEEYQEHHQEHQEHHQYHEEHAHEHHEGETYSPEQQPAEAQGHEGPAAEPDPVLTRLEAIEATLAELRSSIEELKAHKAEAASQEEVVETTAEALLPEPATVAGLSPAPAHADHGPRFDRLEVAIAELRDSLGQVNASITALTGDVAEHRTLHTTTQAMIDEQHNLMRGLNYIITAAIGTLTSAAKPGK